MRGRCGDFVAMVEDGVAYNCNHTCLEALQRMRDSWGALAAAVHRGCMCAARRARGSQLVAYLHVACWWCMPSVSYGESTVTRIAAKAMPENSLPETPGRASKQITKCISQLTIRARLACI
jgi:hypothetical protein